MQGTLKYAAAMVAERGIMNSEANLYNRGNPQEHLYNALAPVVPMVFEPPDPKREGCIIPDYMLLNLNGDSGFHFGRRGDFPGKYIGKPENGDHHILICGGSGSGKSYATAKPTIHSWRSPIFAIDIKGELLAEAKLMRRGVKVLDFTGERIRWKYDVFYFLSQDKKENLAQNVTELANSIIPMPMHVKETFWLESARNLLAGFIMHLYNLGMSFIESMEIIKTTSLTELMDKVCSGSDEIAKAFINPDVKESPKMLAAISEELRNNIRIFVTDPMIQQILDTSDPSTKIVKWEDLERVDVFIRLNHRRLNQWGRVITLVHSRLNYR